MFNNIFAEIKKRREDYEMMSREEREARHGGKGNDPIFRMVEAERVHTNFLNVIPASAILFLVEACGMIWAMISKIKFDFALGFFISFAAFTVAAFVFICIIEKKLNDPDFSLKQKKNIYKAFWALYCIGAMSFSLMELLDRGTVNNYLCFIFTFTLLPIIAPFPKILVIIASFIAEAVCMLEFSASNLDNVLLCFVAVLIAVIVSYSMYFRYMSTKITEKRLEHFANGDQLTMLTNRRGFSEMAPVLKMHCEKNSLKLLVVMADIDNFKIYNDTYGHLEGDICLKNVAAVIRKNFSRPTDICARYGGEEFVVMGTVDDENIMLEHIKELLNDVEKTASKGDCRVTLSIGVCILEANMKAELNELIKAADAELYNAKSNGKNCISCRGKIYRN